MVGSYDGRRPFYVELAQAADGPLVAALYGGFAGEPFTDDSEEYVFVARKR